MGQKQVGIGYPFDDVRQTAAAQTPREYVPADPQLGYHKKGYRVVELDLATARKDEKLNLQGTLFWAIDGTDSKVKITVKIDDQINDAIPVYPGIEVSGIPFDQLYITNAAQAGKTITLFIAMDWPRERIDSAQ